MTAGDGVPGTLREYVEVYASVLLRPLNEPDRERAVSTVVRSYAGSGPWPEFGQMQRTVEYTMGLADAEAIVGEIVLLGGTGGWEGMVARLRDPELHSSAVRQLGQQQDCVVLADVLSDAQTEGILTGAEAEEILAAVRSHHPLQPLMEQPAPLQPLVDWPEAWAEVTAHDRGFVAIELSADQQRAYKAAREAFDAGTSDSQEFRKRWTRAIRPDSVA